MLLSENPGEYYDCGCAVSIILNDDNKPLKDFMRPPDSIRIEGHKIYRFIFSGCLWAYIISKHSETFKNREFLLQKDGKLILPMQRAGETELFRRIASDLYSSGKLK
jgi:hypothetical protein